MCKDYPVLFLPQYKEFLPEKLCLKMITSEDMAPALKSSLVQFYIESYLSSKCTGIALQKFPDMLKLRENDYEEKYCKFNENLRTQTLKEMTLEGGRRNLKDYIFKYLEDPENYINIQPEFLESLLDLLIFLIKRGFLIVQEIAEIKLAIFNFLKYFMSNDFKEKFKGIAEFLIDNNPEGKMT